MSLPYKVGSSDQNTGGEITPWGRWFASKYKSYAAPVDGYFGNQERDAVKELQRRLGLPITGIFDQLTAAKSGYGGAKPPAAHRPIWFYSAPGSGASWNVGPSFEVGQRCQDVLGINHQPVGFPMGGYLGLMGGDPSFSYNEVIAAEGIELERLIASCPDLNDPNVEFWFSGYSQSADGMEDALVRLFGDGGRFAHLRPRINGVIQFGNPSKTGTGIARKLRPPWLLQKVHNLNHPNDFYAEAPDNIRPPMYRIICEAEMELPFFVHVLRLAARIIPDWLTFLPIGSIFGGGAFGPLAQLAIGGMTGLAGNPLLGNMFGMAGRPGDTKVDDDLYNLLKPTGVLSNVTGLIGLVGALPGIQSHGDWGPFVDPAFDVVARFRR